MLKAIISDLTHAETIERYDKNIRPLIGDMLLKDIKPLHCQNVLN
ncbi:MAG: hypothetical protein HFH14_07330 [Lachnospiraceae bacterium]|nr:hypothetical protein [Lachnospiraceae bacterium]